jgi:hypothetical protein
VIIIHDLTGIAEHRLGRFTFSMAIGKGDHDAGNQAMPVVA